MKSTTSRSRLVNLINGTSCLRWACDVDAKGAFDSHQTIAIHRDLGTQQGRHVHSSDQDPPTYLIRSDGWNISWKRSTRSWLDRTAIVARSCRDRGSIEPRSWLIWRDRGTRSRHDWCPTIVMQSWPPIGTQYQIKRLINRAKIPFKKTMYSPFYS